MIVVVRVELDLSLLTLDDDDKILVVVAAGARLLVEKASAVWNSMDLLILSLRLAGNGRTRGRERGVYKF